jgi:hypothetical protein
MLYSIMQPKVTCVARLLLIVRSSRKPVDDFLRFNGVFRVNVYIILVFSSVCREFFSFLLN